MDIFVQSPVWARFQRNLGRTVHEVDGQGWRFVAIEEPRRVGAVMYLPYGPVARDRQKLREALTAAATLARERHALWLRVEPISGSDRNDIALVLQEMNFRRAPRDIHPKRTRIIDINRPWDEIFSHIHPTTRGIYRNYHKKDVTIVASRDISDIPTSIKIIQEAAAKNKFRNQQDDYLYRALNTLLPEGAATIYLQYWRDIPIGTAIAYDSADTRYYMYSGNDEQHRSLNVGNAVLVQLIADAHAQGLHYVDLWGIAPDNQPDHPWAGFSAFKARFGGRVVDYAGTWDAPALPLVYTGYRGARVALSQLRQVRAHARAARPGMHSASNS